MHFGTPEPVTSVAAAPAAGGAAVPQLNLADCTPDEPMVLSVRIRGTDRVWKVGHRHFPDWKAAVMAAHVVMGRLPGFRASLACGYFSSFADGTYRPERLPWWCGASADEIMSIYPKRYFENYQERVRAGCGVPLPGDEHLNPGVAPRTN